MGAARGYARAYIDRDASGKDGPLRFVAATEGKKGDGIDLRMAGARLDRYQANPIIGYGHSYWGRQSLPIGRADNVAVDGKRLLMDVTFDPADEFAMTVDRKYRDGYLNAVSIGFDVYGWEEPNASYWTGGTATDWELLETSAVPLPMDADAVVESGRDQAVALARALTGWREGKVLSTANAQIIGDVVTALQDLLDAAAGTAAVEAAAGPAGASRLALARRRLRLAELG